MCGIVGYVGKRSSIQILIDGLKRLEYRGYDSAGIAFQNGGGIEVYKTKGKINNLQNILPTPAIDARVGLGHTRWATHGTPSSRNAHPHGADGVVVVHNGIIENYCELKSRLIAEGHEFSSDTDTEVIPQMISRYMKEGFSLMDAIKETTSRLRGSFAVGIISKTHPDTLFAIRKGSPLVLGIGDGEYFIASDTPAILPYTRRFIFMEDGQMCVLRNEGFELLHLFSDDAVSIEDRIVEVDWTPSMAEKEGYPHFMLKEIHEQPRAIRDTISEWIDDPLKLLDEFGLTMRMTIELSRLQIVACGTSYHAGLVGRHIIESLTHIPVDVEIASEYRYKEHIIENGTLFISITQSGETADTLAAQREAKARGARTLTFCNVVGSTSSREADSILYTRAGPEIGVASTKTFTAQIAALCLVEIGRASCRERV